ncbi:hypothetical protein Q4F19_14765 [Sphingomonas sp. BIUV-7]|uniref:Uncharacterized protein n=1 Tax=Sphingomonas natans TaxID=3063330 RepID=A0ABT8YDG4_9SPHN|nr:hypothetical protein [Sphingomonas sp. BIUV-7]MDO6415650.1 hypothetical protein [Sphingomonas sp. BIUV-7]
MADRLSRPRASALLIQLLAIVSIVGVTAAAPPASGRMMLVPLSAEAAHGMVAMAIDRGASLVGSGPLPGSLVVDGDRAALLGALVRHGVALLAAPAAGCGQ